MSDVVFLPDYTDVNPYQSELADGLDDEGFDVHLCGGRVLPLIQAVVAGDSPDLIHLHWLHQFILADSRTLTAAKLLRFATELVVVRVLLGCSVVWTVHNLLEHERRWPRIERTVKRAFVRFVADEVIVHCPAAAEAVRSEYALPDEYDAIEVVRHGHYIDSYENDVSEREARDLLDLDPERCVLLFVGAIRPYKDVPELLESFERADAEGMDLFVAGDPQNEAVQAQVRSRTEGNDRIHTDLRFIRPDELQVYLNAADAVVVPHRDVLTSGTVVLGMSFGLAVVAPRTGCLPETVSDGGILFSPDDDDGLRRAIEEAVTADLEAMGERNYERARTFDWDRIATETARVYRKSLR